ncbi:hypothetical protein CVT25_010116 [Psilocybe cyanescens]|uniref:Protein kinase domain-containing protein n=1 Tax=Psilocybe cyanescens TaxID=93625 RepID=A0A409XD33_PSICY|nr:hypothetical protein CVT25_010116 [Psilocybe cyanescens]
MTTSHLECPGATGGSSLRSRSSGSSTSSLSSTFSDITSSTSASSSSPPNLKTNAFFASPFSTRSPSPTPHAPATPAQSKPRSLTAEFFGTPVRPPSPPASSISAKNSAATPHISRIFPSRYTSVPDRSPEFNLNLLNFDSVSDETSKFNARARTPSTGSSSSFSSSLFHEPRLPTPPPSHGRTPERDDTLMQDDFPPTPRQEEPDSYDEPTPRPADRQPGLLRFERDLILERQAKQKLSQAPKPPPEPLESESIHDSDVDEEPHPGSIISLPSPEFRSSHLPLSPLSLTFTIASPSPSLSSRPLDRGTPTPTNEYSTSSASLKSSQPPSPEFKPLPSPPPSDHDHSHAQSVTPIETTQTPHHSSTLSTAPLPPAKDTDKEKDHTQVPKLRLLRPLGHGAFSAVWLAEDLSRVPLTLVSKKSVRDLRRRASGRERERERQKGRERDKDAAVHGAKRDNGGKSNASSSTTVNGEGAPSRNRIREGLMSMLSFSRSATLGIGAMSTSPGPSPISPMSATGFDSGEDGGGGLSRNSSIKSTSVSRQSSVRSSASSFKGPSRATSLRLAPQQDMTLSRDSSLKKFRERVRGTRPAFRLGRVYLDERHGEMGEPRDVGTASAVGVMGGNRRVLDDGDSNMSVDSPVDVDDDGIGLGASLSRQSSLGIGNGGGKGNGRLVAVKMTPRRANIVVAGQTHGTGIGKERLREEEERTRVGFVREVEVLKHISHPNITPLLAHLSTASHHILVLPYLPGGDLLGLVNNDVAWGMLSESVLRRIWCEICKAVGWMHGVGLVHRDIKLESNSLTPSSPRPMLSTLPAPPAPFIKLTDFGLSRFVEIDANGEAELLSTRCGSEAYAAPELVTGGGGGGGGVYDARRTDAWACGVVLYALVGRQLPFGEGVVVGGHVGGGSKIGGERGKDGGGGFGGGGRRATAADRRHWLMRIARGEWEWPGGEDVGHNPGSEEEEDCAQEKEQELVGPRLCKSRGARRIVSRLLVRDPKKRARVGDLWDEAWMQGVEDEAWWRDREMRTRMEEDASENEDWVSRRARQQLDVEGMDDMSWSFYGNEDALSDLGDVEFYDEPSHLGQMRMNVEEDEDEDEDEDERLEDEEEEEGGCLFDHEGIDSITRQELEVQDLYYFPSLKAISLSASLLFRRLALIPPSVRLGLSRTPISPLLASVTIVFASTIAFIG